MVIVEMLPGIYHSDISITERLDYISKWQKHDRDSQKKNPDGLLNVIALERLRVYVIEYVDLILRESDEEYSKKDDRLMYNARMVEYNVTEGNFIHSLILDYASGQYEIDGIVDILIDIIRYFNERVDSFNDALCKEMKDDYYSGHFQAITIDYIDRAISEPGPFRFFPNPRNVGDELLAVLKTQLRLVMINDIIN